MNSGAYVSSGKAKPSQTKKGPGGKGRRKQGDDCRVHDHSLSAARARNEAEFGKP